MKNRNINTFIFRSSKLRSKGNFRYLLSEIFGIGFSKAFYLCDVLGVGRSVRIENLKWYNFRLIIYLIRKYYLTDLFLKKYVYDNVKFIVESKSYKAFRIIFALPCNGQRTKSNSNTSKRMRNIEVRDKFSLSNFIRKISVKK